MKADREILERAVAAVAEQAAETDALVHEAVEIGLGGSAPLTIRAKVIRQELLRVKAELERELERLELDCTSCGQRVHWVSGLGVRAGHRAHREPAPHGAPVIA